MAGAAGPPVAPSPLRFFRAAPGQPRPHLPFSQTSPNIRETPHMTIESPPIAVDDDEETYVQSVARFVAAADWLNDTHRPALKVLRSLAKILDGELERGKAPQAALVSQFSLTYRDLAGKSPAAAKTDDTLPPPLDFPGGDWR